MKILRLIFGLFAVVGLGLLIGGVVMWIIDALNAKSETAGEKAPGGRIHTWHMEER